MISLVLGGNKSGKSDFALNILYSSPQPWTMLATGKALDLAFRRQIRKHRRERSKSISIMECGPCLASNIVLAGENNNSIIVDSLDFWLFSLPERNQDYKALLSTLAGWSGKRLILVSSEVGLGPVAANSSTRAYIRRLGELNREVARISQEVFLTVAGLPLKLK